MNRNQIAHWLEWSLSWLIGCNSCFVRVVVLMSEKCAPIYCGGGAVGEPSFTFQVLIGKFGAMSFCRLKFFIAVMCVGMAGPILCYGGNAPCEGFKRPCRPSAWSTSRGRKMSNLWWHHLWKLHRLESHLPLCNSDLSVPRCISLSCIFMSIFT